MLDEEFKDSLIRSDLDAALKILQSLRYVLDACKTDMPRAGSLIKGFFLIASGIESLRPLQDVWPAIEPARAEKIGRILMLLEPDALHALSGLLPLSQAPQLRKILLETIILLASRDMGPLESLLRNPDEKIMERLIPVLTGLDGERPFAGLMKPARHARSPFFAEPFSSAYGCLSSGSRPFEKAQPWR